MLAKCSDCGASWVGGLTCRDHFHQMLYWENEDPARGEVHHLMVLCYHLQHPSLYSAEGLAGAQQLLADFVENGLGPEAVRGRDQPKVASGARRWSITARPDNRGAYERPIVWSMRARDVVAGGATNYVENVRSWAASVWASIRPPAIEQ
ncbi:DUF5946 family protein [Promineifilum sp.]|uniref:DUF5946 family protein n=1 Tax=Promineifilum sp. TaxID=2664178 RepID=UPI0031CCA4A4